jgi:2,4-dienoyl-CoA reductase-like NADH-dependent reductase (Old Yellow Enzyme family)
MSTLFTPLDIGPLRLANRIVIAPMCQYSAVGGAATDWHLVHLGHLALSGAGLLIIEATAVEAAGRITPGCLGLWSDANEAALQRVLQAVRAHSRMPVAIQLGHAGRKASSHVPWEGGMLIPPDQPGGWRPLASSALPQLEGEALPEELDETGLQRIVTAFADAAQRAHRLGLDAIELHAAHGYLLHQFLSPIANVRRDAYGGSLPNRMRFPLQVFEAVRAAVPASMPVGVRISATDWVEGGWSVDDAVRLSALLRDIGVDLIDCSSGGLSKEQKIAIAPGYQVPFARRIRHEARIATGAVGLITTATQAERIVADGDADVVLMAREFLRNPRWPLLAAHELGATGSWPDQYLRAKPR